MFRKEKNDSPPQSEPFVVLGEGNVSPFVFNSPHSGRDYSDAFLKSSKLDALAIRKSEDAFVDELFSSSVKIGAQLLCANFPRAFVDVNREPFELDPVLFDDNLPPYANTQSVRVLGGLGTIARVVTDAEEIYEEAPTIEEALERINLYYWPYHNKLQSLLETAKRRFGYAVLVDCHSMPSISVEQGGRSRADFILGDRFGSSCANAFTQIVEDTLVGMGYTVVRNTPYAGGFVTEHYGRPVDGIHALQIEINRMLYMEEACFEKKAGFELIQADLEKLCAVLLENVPQVFGCSKHAAE